MKKQPHPIELVVVATSKCNLKCSFCYVGNRSRENELNYKKLINFIHIIHPKSIEITGGEPCLYPRINELIHYARGRGIKVGMTSNGTCLHLLDEKNLKRLTWLRISLNHFIDNNIPFKDPPYPEKYGYIYIKTKWETPVNLQYKLRKFIWQISSYIHYIIHFFQPDTSPRHL